MPKNVFEMMPILMSLTFRPRRSLGFFQLICYLIRSLSRETLNSLSCLYIGGGGVLFAKGKIEFILFHTEKGFAFVLLLFCFLLCLKSKLQELWGSVQA